MYNSFSYGYDKLMSDADYEGFAVYYQKIFNKFGAKPELVLDLGCGSGRLTEIMADCGYDMIGLDISEEMLSIARDKHMRSNILYLHQDMREFELFGTVDVIYSSMDCINYITHINDLKKVFKLANNYLNPGGLLIFDVITEYGFSKEYGGDTYVFDTDDVYLVWKNMYNKSTRRCTLCLDMFYKTEDVYNRYYEEQEKRAYTCDELKRALISSGFEILGIYHEFCLSKIKNNTKRAFFTARRVK